MLQNAKKEEPGTGAKRNVGKCQKSAGRIE